MAFELLTRSSAFATVAGPDVVRPRRLCSLSCHVHSGHVACSRNQLVIVSRKQGAMLALRPYGSNHTHPQELQQPLCVTPRPVPRSRASRSSFAARRRCPGNIWRMRPGEVWACCASRCSRCSHVTPPSDPPSSKCSTCGRASSRLRRQSCLPILPPQISDCSYRHRHRHLTHNLLKSWNQQPAEHLGSAVCLSRRPAPACA
jgi:hypothetical protein